jgi:hypothetical protein
MHKCEFCHTEFQPRPQVKRPRACVSCQDKRQRSNEYDWRMRNPQYSSAEYHELMREKRKKCLKEAAERLVKCIEVGRDFLGVSLRMDGIEIVLAEFLASLGVRRLNKLWDLQIAM